MEYEIEAEHSLFDRSTNPSLEHIGDRKNHRKGKNRKAIHIPEEEPESQMH